MLDANDVRMFEEILDRKLDEKLDQKLDQKLGVFRDELVTEMAARFHTELHKELYKVRNDIIDVINGVLPQIDGLDRRVSRIERWARLA